MNETDELNKPNRVVNIKELAEGCYQGIVIETDEDGKVVGMWTDIGSKVYIERAVEIVMSQSVVR